MMPHHFYSKKKLKKLKRYIIIKIIWHYFIEWTKQVWQTYMVFNGKYRWRGC